MKTTAYAIMNFVIVAVTSNNAKKTEKKDVFDIKYTPFDVIDYCQSKGIAVEAYSPVAHGEAMKNEKIVQMAKKYGVTVPPLCIRYDIQLGLIVLPKTANPAHMKSNGELDFEITEEDMTVLKNIEKIKDYGDSSFFPVFGEKL